MRKHLWNDAPKLPRIMDTRPTGIVGEHGRLAAWHVAVNHPRWRCMYMPQRHFMHRHMMAMMNRKNLKRFTKGVVGYDREISDLQRDKDRMKMLAYRQ